ncbi:MAG: thioredoxin domain-containing protein [bacterium]|nr:thioredoxin domain-containing protein [bacterium]
MELKSDHSIAGAILVVGLAIAYAIYAAPATVVAPEKEDDTAREQIALLENTAPISEADHIRGTTTPELTIITYGDYECPFCKMEHLNMVEVFPEYADRMQWVMRHFPLPIHAKARTEALATECAATLGGHDAFWKYSDRLYEITPSNDGLDLTLLPGIANDIGLDVATFNTCMETAEERIGSMVDAHRDEAIATGGRGTPWNILISKDGTRTSIEGALTKENFRLLFNELLK